jgi:amino acid transporter
MNACIISVLPMQQAMTSKSVVSDYIGVLISPSWSKVISILILWTAFASIFSLMLGYSRILYAAARDKNFFSIFATLHSTKAYPIVSVLFLGAIATIFCNINLKSVLQAILSIRAIIPFMAQIVGAVVLRVKEPNRPLPFRMWLYPLPAIIALGLWTYVLVSPAKGIRVGGLYVIAAGLLFYGVREALYFSRKTQS